MAEVRRFVFETEFARDGADACAAPKRPERFSRAEAEAMEQAAYQRGAQDAAAKAAQELAQSSAAAAQALTKLLNELGRERASLRAEAATLALAAARKIAGAALDSYSVDRIMASIDAALDALRHNPRVVITIAPSQVEALRERLQEAAPHHAGAIIVRGAEGFAVGDVSIDWGDGAVIDKSEDALRAIEARVVQALVEGDTP